MFSCPSCCAPGFCSCDEFPYQSFDNSKARIDGSQPEPRCSHNVRAGKRCHHCENRRREAAIAGDAEGAPLLPTPLHPLTKALRDAEATLSIDGSRVDLSSGFSISAEAGTPRYSGAKEQKGAYDPGRWDYPISFKSFLSLVLLGLMLAGASGASGYEGATATGGTSRGLGSWGATSVLNYDGYIQFLYYLMLSGLSFTKKLVLAILVGFLLAALPPAVLSGEGAAELIPHNHKAVEFIFGAINFIVSGALNVKSLLNLPAGVMKYIGRVRGKTPVWDSTCGDRFSRVIIGVMFIPSLYASLNATIGRGHSTYELVLDKLKEAGAISIFSATGIVGFAMFLYGVLSLILMLERMIKIAVTQLWKRTGKYFAVKDFLINGLAMSIATGSAFFVFLNYKGLLETSYNSDWFFGKVLESITWGIEELAIAPAASVAAMNLIQRTGNFADYMRRLVAQLQYARSTTEARAAAKAHSEAILAEYERVYPGGLANFSKNIFPYFTGDLSQAEKDYIYANALIAAPVGYGAAGGVQGNGDGSEV